MNLIVIGALLILIPVVIVLLIGLWLGLSRPPTWYEDMPPKNWDESEDAAIRRILDEE